MPDYDKRSNKGDDGHDYRPRRKFTFIEFHIVWFIWVSAMGLVFLLSEALAGIIGELAYPLVLSPALGLAVYLSWFTSTMRPLRNAHRAINRGRRRHRLARRFNARFINRKGRNRLW